MSRYTQLQNLGIENDELVNPTELIRLELLSSLEKYTRVMFKQQYGSQFIVSNHHRLMFEALQRVVDCKCNKLIINMPPRYSKTEIAIKSFISWCFALNPKCKFLHLSYSDVLVNGNSETIRSIMTNELYKALFPKSRLKSEKGSTKQWKTAAGGELYAVSTQGQVTGFGAGGMQNYEDDTELTNNELLNQLLDSIGARSNVFQGAVVIDDPLKPEDAESDVVRERINLRFESTIRNRTNSRNTPIIIIMQRLHEHDLCGYLKEIEPGEWEILSLPALYTNKETGEEEALWPLKHTVDELHKIRKINPIVFDTQYMQDPTPKAGLMYANGFRTYTNEELRMLPQSAKRLAYFDTADTGSDSLCGIAFVDTPEFVYVTNVYFSEEPPEVTERSSAEMLVFAGTKEALFESNAGGRQFARNVKRILRSEMHCFRTTIHTFAQTQNKQSRIYNYSANVMNDILFPDGWDRMWPEFYNAIMSYRKDNKKKNKHDDAPDCLTGVYEMHAKKVKQKKIKRRN